MSAIIHHPLKALRSRDFRLYFAGQLVSVAGTWMQQIAMGWLAYRLTDSALVLGLLGFASQAPILLFGALGGVWSDRWDRRRLMMLTQTLAMCQAMILAILTWQGWITPSLLLTMAFVMGCINALDMPARQSLVVHLVSDRTHLQNAIALNSLLMNATRFIAPALAGFIIALLGEAICFILNATSYLAVLLALWAIRARPGGDRSKPALHALREGLSYTFSHRDIRLFLMLVAAVSFLVAPYVVMMPVYVKTIFHGDASTFGLLVSSAGAGSLSGSLFLATRGSITGLAQRVSLAAVSAGAALALFALNTQHALAYPILMLGRRGVGPVCPEYPTCAGLPNPDGAGLFRGAGRRRQQHPVAELGAGRHAGPGHGHLLDGLPRRCAARQPGGRQPGARHRHPPDIIPVRRADAAGRAAALPTATEYYTAG